MKGEARQRTILVTGASGYLGYACAVALEGAGHRVRFGARSPGQARGAHAWTFYGDLASPSGLDAALAGCDTVIHFAGLAHLPEGPGSERLAREVNVEGTARLAQAASRCGVKRFIFISSAHVNGPSSRDRPFSESDIPHPDNVYARSKLEAELRLKNFAAGGGMDWIIVRPPMVYGPGAPGNFRRLVKLVRMGLPVPLGGACAPKSFLFAGNLTSAMVALVDHPGAANETFLVADSEVTSTAGLLRLIADALGRRSMLVNVPEAPLALAARVIGRDKDVRRLFDPLEIDGRRIREALHWVPPVSLAEGVRRSVASE